MARRVGSASAPKTRSAADAFAEGLQLPNGPAALEAAVILGSFRAPQLAAGVEQFHERATVERGEADRDERGCLPAMPDPVLFEGQLARRIEHHDVADE